MGADERWDHYRKNKPSYGGPCEIQIYEVKREATATRGHTNQQKEFRWRIRDVGRTTLANMILLGNM